MDGRPVPGPQPGGPRPGPGPQPVPGALPGPPAVAGSTAPAGTPPSEVVRALERLSELDDLPLHEHVEVLDDVHRLLQDALASLDER